MLSKYLIPYMCPSTKWRYKKKLKIVNFSKYFLFYEDFVTTRTPKLAGVCSGSSFTKLLNLRQLILNQNETSHTHEHSLDVEGVSWRRLKDCRFFVFLWLLLFWITVFWCVWLWSRWWMSIFRRHTVLIQNKFEHVELLTLIFELI